MWSQQRGLPGNLELEGVGGASCGQRLPARVLQAAGVVAVAKNAHCLTMEVKVEDKFAGCAAV